MQVDHINEEYGPVIRDLTYEVVTDEGKFCASSNSLVDARYYALVYGQDGPVELYEVHRWKIV